ncbi:hypothetical protein D3C78_1418200 [compost metagenome]
MQENLANLIISWVRLRTASILDVFYMFLVIMIRTLILRKKSFPSPGSSDTVLLKRRMQSLFCWIPHGKIVTIGAEHLMMNS